DVARAEHVLGLAGLAEGEHRVVLDHPDFVHRTAVAQVGETLHSTPDRLVGPAAEVADDGRARAHTRLLSLRRQGEVGKGWTRFTVLPRAPLPSPPLPSQGRKQRLTASTSPPDARAGPRARSRTGRGRRRGSSASPKRTCRRSIHATKWSRAARRCRRRRAASGFRFPGRPWPAPSR